MREPGIEGVFESSNNEVLWINTSKRPWQVFSSGWPLHTSPHLALCGRKPDLSTRHFVPRLLSGSLLNTWHEPRRPPLHFYTRSWKIGCHRIFLFRTESARLWVTSRKLFCRFYTWVEAYSKCQMWTRVNRSSSGALNAFLKRRVRIVLARPHLGMPLSASTFTLCYVSLLLLSASSYLLIDSRVSQSAFQSGRGFRSFTRPSRVAAFVRHFFFFFFVHPSRKSHTMGVWIEENPMGRPDYHQVWSLLWQKGDLLSSPPLGMGAVGSQTWIMARMLVMLLKLGCPVLRQVQQE